MLHQSHQSITQLDVPAGHRTGDSLFVQRNRDIRRYPSGEPGVAVELVHRERLNPNKAAYYLGDSLKWSHMSFSGRKNAIGPVHIIGCYKSITENQARKIPGFPDATLVRAPFRISLADNVQNIQMIFLQDRRNENETIGRLELFHAWPDKSGEKLPL